MSTDFEFSNFARSLKESASDVYDKIVEFNDPGSLYNDPAPEPYVAFILGGIFTAITWIYYVVRLRKLHSFLNAQSAQWTTALHLRAMISSFIDANDAGYVICKMAAQSFIFLGGLQYNYELALGIMLAYFAFESCFDTLRILLAMSEVNSLADLMVTGSGLRTKLRNAKAEVKPGNVYEDISRRPSVVLMVFATQCLLISFVVTDIYQNPITSCRDGTPNCPIVGTFGSWSFYVLGIFMACVFLLGPKTSFGQSEQNPAYWLQLLLASKGTGAKATWYDVVKDKQRTRTLAPSDPAIWARFVMSFLINGVGFHILVHALPIQVASQNSLTGVVFRAVGMMYLVDLDDTPGVTLTLQEEHPEIKNGKQQDTDDEDTKKEKDDEPVTATLSETQISEEAQRILNEAQAKLDALKQGKPVSSGGGTSAALMGGVFTVAAGAAVAAGSTSAPSNKNKNQVELQEEGQAGEGQDGGDGEEVDGGGDE